MRLPAIGLVLIVVLTAACSPAASEGPTPPAAAPSSATATARPSRAPSSATATARPSRAPGASNSRFDPTGLSLDIKVVVDGFDNPVDVTHAGDGTGRLFVVEQAGRIRIVAGDALVDKPYLDIVDRVGSGGERGLLGLAFHPDYPTDPRLFVDYTDRSGDTVIASFRVSGADPTVADPASESVILRIDQPFANHNGGAVAFGPDGMLYIGMGDGGSAGDPQGNGRKLTTLLAKVLRIDVNGVDGAPYAIPTGNPFVGVPDARGEIWSTGMRNPWRMRFDRANGDLWIGDVGQGRWEEIDVARAGVGGLDFGWNTMEGSHCFRQAEGCDQTGLTTPVAEYGHDFGCAVIGGVVVRNAQAGRLDGGYLYGDACSDNVWALDPVGDDVREGVIVGRAGHTLSSIGEAEDGTVYATSLEDFLLRISAGG